MLCTLRVVGRKLITCKLALEWKQVWLRKSQGSEQEPKPNFRMMKEELLDIEAILSEVAACLTVTHLDIEKAKFKPPLVDALSTLSGKVSTHTNGRAYDRILDGWIRLSLMHRKALAKGNGAVGGEKTWTWPLKTWSVFRLQEEQWQLRALRSGKQAGLRLALQLTEYGLGRMIAGCRWPELRIGKASRSQGNSCKESSWSWPGSCFVEQCSFDG